MQQAVGWRAERGAAAGPGDDDDDDDYQWIRYLGGGRGPARADVLTQRSAEPGRGAQRGSDGRGGHGARRGGRRPRSAKPRRQSRTQRMRQDQDRRALDAQKRVQAERERGEQAAERGELAAEKLALAEPRQQAGGQAAGLPAGAVSEPSASRQPRSVGRRRQRRSRKRRLWPAAGAVLVTMAVGVAAAAVVLRPAGGARHILVTPARIGAYAQVPALAAEMKADQLRSGIVADSSGEATHVVDAVYEDVSGAAARSGPQIVLLIGGNLSGTSAGSFISSFIGRLQGAVTANPGSLAGDAACVPSKNGGLAECAWADDDTFGVIASPTLGAAALAKELRQMRPRVEHSAS